MKIAVVGAGSVGLAMTASAAVAGAEVFLVARGTSAQEMSAKGIHVTGVLGEHIVAPEKLRILNLAYALPACDVIIVATKATDVASVLTALAPVFEADKRCPPILLVQNGWGWADEAKNMLPEGTPIFCASLMTGIERLSPTEVRINGHSDDVRVGSFFGDGTNLINPLVDLLKKGFLPFAYEPMIKTVLLKKLLFSLCLNPLSAILRLSYGDLCANGYAAAMMENLADEAVKVVLSTQGIILYKDGMSYIRDYLVPDRISRNSKHRSSMLQDVEAGRRTEILYITGAISKMGRECGVSTPCNDMVTGLILALESISKTREA